MTRLFGTDGIRGVFGEPPLDEETVIRLGVELARTLHRPRPRVLIGGDTRHSTPALAAWVTAGLEAAGAVVSYAGILPTPGVAFLTRSGNYACGIAISASHNPLPDNGIKLIDARGFKWSRAEEEALERRVAASVTPVSVSPQPSIEPELALVGPYLESLLSPLPAGSLGGLRLCLDLANGAASPFAGELFTSLGADVSTMAARPDGHNINRGCGSTRPDRLAKEVCERGADLGLAFDGDADRVILVDESGAVRDGDAILYLWARHLHEQGRLVPPRIVVTTMSNLGLRRSLHRLGIDVEVCDVGDRAVVERLRQRDLVLGGEQSGHVINLALSTTGDGLLTALHVCTIVDLLGKPLSELLADLERCPQVLRNVRVREKRDFSTVPALADAAARVERSLGEDGRLLLRYSGTEPVARVMIEGNELALIERLADELAIAIDQHLGGVS